MDYYHKYRKYKYKYIQTKHFGCEKHLSGGGKKYKCGKYSYEKTPKPTCNKLGGIKDLKINGEKFYGWNLQD